MEENKNENKDTLNTEDANITTDTTSPEDIISPETEDTKDLTSTAEPTTPTEPKFNKKKVIIISSIAGAVVLIGLMIWFISGAIKKGKEIVEGVGSISNSIEDSIDKITNAELTTEEPIEETTEEETTEEDPFTAVAEGSYTDEDYETYFKIRTYENGAKRYVYHIDSEDKDYEFSSMNQKPGAVIVDMLAKMDSSGLSTEIETVIISSSIENTDTPQKSTEVIIGWTEEERIEKLIESDKSEYNHMAGEEIHNLKIQWLRDNYGDSFTCKGKEFNYDASYNDYIVIEKQHDIHLMTSTTTSTLGYYYYKERYYRIADYLGFYGTDYGLYNNEEAFEYTRMIQSGVDTGSTAPNAEEINESYLKQLGWIEEVETSEEIHYWEFTSTEGIPVTVYGDGYININIKYPTDTEYQRYEFTIEEYNEFVATHTWTVSSKYGYTPKDIFSDDDDNMIKFIEKYLIIE